MKPLTVQSSWLPISSFAITPQVILSDMGYDTANITPYVAERVSLLLQEMQECANPTYGYALYNGVLGERTLTIDRKNFNLGKIIARSLQGSGLFALFTASAGMEFQQWQTAQSDPLDQYIADTIGTILVESIADQMQYAITQEAIPRGLHNTNRFSPGYCGWHLSEQKVLFELLPLHACSGITLSESCLMLPIKSVSGIIGLGKEVSQEEYACNLCHFPNCFRRRIKQKPTKSIL